MMIFSLVVATVAVRINGGSIAIPCDVQCLWGRTAGVVKHLHISDLNKKCIMSMEGEQYYPSLRRTDRNVVYATTSFASDIPMPYFNWRFTDYVDPGPRFVTDLQAPPNAWLTSTKAALFMARNCHSKSNRETLVRQLINENVAVHSISSCVHNFDYAGSRKSKKHVMQQYLLYLAFENQLVDDYITEKLWDALRAGILPVYHGAPNIYEHVPPGSIVNVRDFTSVHSLAAHLKQILASKELYESYHTWRRYPLPMGFKIKYNFTHVHSACRLCRFVYAKTRGLGWNRAQQQIIWSNHSPV